MKEQNFGARAHKDAAMQDHHPTKMRFGNFSNALFFELPLVAARNPQFREPPDPDEHKQGEIGNTSWPLQQDHLRRESRPERHQQAVAPRRHFFLNQPFVQNE